MSSFQEINLKQPFYHLLKHCLIHHWFKITGRKCILFKTIANIGTKWPLTVYRDKLCYCKSHQWFIFCLPCFNLLYFASSASKMLIYLRLYVICKYIISTAFLHLTRFLMVHGYQFQCLLYITGLISDFTAIFVVDHVSIIRFCHYF